MLSSFTENVNGKAINEIWARKWKTLFSSKIGQCSSVTKKLQTCWLILLKRRTGSGKRGTSTVRGKMKNGTKLRIGNEGTDRARVQIRFCSHFSFPRSRFRVPDPRFSYIRFGKCDKHPPAFSAHSARFYFLLHYFITFLYLPASVLQFSFLH